MSVVVRNGNVAMEAKPKGIDAPTPSQIAERAYDLAIARAVEALSTTYTSGVPGYDQCGLVREFMVERRAATLASLRDSVINPDAIPWWRK